MASKMIRDSPELLDETLLSAAKACKYPLLQCSRASLERWLRRGCQGIVLESIRICGKRYTSEEAINRFIRRQLQVEAEKAQPEPTKSSLSKKALAEASRRFGLPEPK